MGKKYIVKSDHGERQLTKSKNLVGLKSADTTDLSDKKYVDKKFHRNLGGFEVVRLNKDDKEDLDDALDKVRGEDEINLGTHVYYAEGSDRPLVPNGEVYIVFKEGLNREEKLLVLDEFNLELLEDRDDGSVVAKVTDKSPNPIKVADALSEISLVEFAEPDMDTYLDEYDYSTPLDGLFSHQWHLENKGLISDANYRIKRGADAKITAAWKALNSLGSNKVTIAIVDNGFDLSHPDLKRKIYKPFDFWNQSSDILQGDPNFTHGTPCASIALASVNGSGIVGVAPNARFMPLSGTSFSDRGTEDIFNYAINQGADIVSCSWGTTDAQLRPGRRKVNAIAKAAKQGRNGKGCIVLYAVGNDDLDYVSYYAEHPDVIAVAASTSKDRHATYSNRGRFVDVCAPSNGDWPLIAARAWWDEGTTLRGAGDLKYWADGRSRGNRYKHFGGTSGATPLVAGICALMLTANPNLTAKEVKDILIKTADKIGEPYEYQNGHSVKYGHGRVNAERAVAEVFRRKNGGTDQGNNDTRGGSTGGGSGPVIIRPDKPSNPDINTNPKPPVTIPSVSGNGQGVFRFSVKREPLSGYSVQVGVFAQYGNVLIHAEKYEAQFGEPILVSINQLRGQTVYKVLVGSKTRRSDANAILARLRKAGIAGFVRSIESLK